MMLVTYLHWIGKPKYIGEGKPGREKVLNRGSIYGNFLKKNKQEHVCILVIGKHANKTSALLNEQGLISWLGMKIRRQGSLLNAVSYGDMGCGHGIRGEDNPTKRPEVRDKISNTKKGSKLITNGTLTKVLRKGMDTPEGWWHGTGDAFNETRRIGGLSTKGIKRTQEQRDRMSIEGTGKKHWTDGKNNKFQKESPGDEWFRGKTEKGPRIMKQVECPHCAKTGSGGNMTRYHFDNCKEIKS